MFEEHVFEVARTTGRPVLDVPERFRGMGLTSPFQIAMMMHLADETPEPDLEWYQETGEVRYSIHDNTIR